MANLVKLPHHEDLQHLNTDCLEEIEYELEKKLHQIKEELQHRGRGNFNVDLHKLQVSDEDRPIMEDGTIGIYPTDNCPCPATLYNIHPYWSCPHISSPEPEDEQENNPDWRFATGHY